MIGGLLKQLFPALGRYVRFRLQQLFGVNATPPAPPASPGVSVSPRTAQPNSAGAIATPASIAALNRRIPLAPEYERRIPWDRHRTNPPPQDVVNDSLYQLWRTIPGGLKWTHYFSIYREVFGPTRTEPLKILEIGVFHGASLKLWRRYFTHPQTVIAAIDINPDCAKYADPAAGIHVRIGSQEDPVFLQAIVDELGPFDLIIDDGSHQSSHIITSFNHLFLAGLKDSGIYFVEDLHANYWHPWRDTTNSFMDVCKELVELMNAHYSVGHHPREFLIDDASEQPEAPPHVPQITTMIREIRFFDAIVAIYKQRRDYVPYYISVAE